MPYTIVSTLYISLANWEHLGLRNPLYIDHLGLRNPLYIDYMSSLEWCKDVGNFFDFSVQIEFICWSSYTCNVLSPYRLNLSVEVHTLATFCLRTDWIYLLKFIYLQCFVSVQIEFICWSSYTCNVLSPYRLNLPVEVHILAMFCLRTDWIYLLKFIYLQCFVSVQIEITCWSSYTSNDLSPYRLNLPVEVHIIAKFCRIRCRSPGPYCQESCQLRLPCLAGWLTNTPH